MSGKSRIKQNPRVLYVVEDITNANAFNPPETLDLIFDSEESAKLYIKYFGKPGYRATMMCKAISVGDLARWHKGECTIIARDPVMETGVMKRFRNQSLTGIRWSEKYA